MPAKQQAFGLELAELGTRLKLFQAEVDRCLLEHAEIESLDERALQRTRAMIDAAEWTAVEAQEKYWATPERRQIADIHQRRYKAACQAVRLFRECRTTLGVAGAFWPEAAKAASAMKHLRLARKRVGFVEAQLGLAGKEIHLLAESIGQLNLEGEQQTRPRRSSSSDEMGTKKLIREWFKEGNLSTKDICARLGNHPRPIRASWRALTWPEALKKYPGPVSKWISLAKRSPAR